MSCAFLLLLLLGIRSAVHSQLSLPGFTTSPFWDEQVLWLTFGNDVIIHENAPSAATLNPNKPTQVVLYALPNGNTINETIGEQNGTNVDWHYLIQEIGAQTRRLRQVSAGSVNIITIYLQTAQLSWPAWRAAHIQQERLLIPNIIRAALAPLEEGDLDSFAVTLCSHSGGGGFMFGLMDASPNLAGISRMCFLDSDYDFDDSPDYGPQLVKYLQSAPEDEGDPSPSLVVVAYDDRNITYNGQPVTCNTCGTYRRTMELIATLQAVPTFNMTYSPPGIVPPTSEPIAVWRGVGLYGGVIDVRIHLNPQNIILHTVLVYMNGFIHATSTTASDVMGPIPVVDDEDVFYGYINYTQWIQPDSP